MNPRELLPLQTVSKQFEECIKESLRQRKCFSVLRSEEELRIYWWYLCLVKHQNHPIVNHFFLNDLRPVVSHWANVFQFNQSLRPLKSLTRNCTQISSLVLQTCAIDENVIKYFNENLKNLKCLVQIDCRISWFNELVSSDQMKHLSKNLIHLGIHRNDKSLNNYIIEDKEILVFIRLFPNLVHLLVTFKTSLSAEKLFEELNPLVKSIDVVSKLTFLDHPIPGHIIARLGHLERLDLLFWISIETMESIITSINLNVFSFYCIDLTSAIMQKMAKCQTQLRQLNIYLTQFFEFNHFETKVVFENVRELTLIRPKLNPIYFKQIVEMFPNLRKFSFNPLDSIECEDNP